MKKFLIVLMALLTMVAFASVPNAEAKKVKVLKAVGTVTESMADKITIKPAKGEPMSFAVTKDTKIKGKVAVDGKVTVIYTKAANGSMTATAVKVASVNKTKK